MRMKMSNFRYYADVYIKGKELPFFDLGGFITKKEYGKDNPKKRQQLAIGISKDKAMLKFLKKNGVKLKKVIITNVHKTDENKPRDMTITIDGQ